ncbi:MAG: argininosuccinate lyase [Oscillospiraceae bacterium]|jgi:argininosuccinate lyase|nr:argininosuccinate lyase [Oscillospiraceae bacterium]
MAKMWAGRLSGDVDDRLNTLNASIAYDQRMAAQDIKGSMAHAAMLRAQGILAASEVDAILQGLSGILNDIESGALLIDPGAEDIHMFIEQELTRRIGDDGKKLHTGRSRNDQVALDLRLYLADEIKEIMALLKTTAQTVCTVAAAHTTAAMPGYTHLQRAQPVTLAHHLMAYVQMFLRDLERLSQAGARTRISPLGSGALASTTYPLNQQMVADTLGLNGFAANSMDGVSDRDFVLELSGALAILMMHLSRLAEEITLWCSWEFRFMALSDQFATGSSIMPQKKNPDIAELLRGKTARVYGDHMTLLTMMKALPLAYNKDMQEDKEAIFDAVDTVKLCLSVLPPMFETATFFPENMRKAAAAGFINATDCADYLVKKGLPFRDAYKITGGLVNRCMALGVTLETLPLAIYKEASDVFSEDIYEAIDLLTCLNQRSLSSGPAPQAVAAQIEAALLKLEGIAL